MLFAVLTARLVREGRAAQGPPLRRGRGASIGRVAGRWGFAVLTARFVREGRAAQGPPLRRGGGGSIGRAAGRWGRGPDGSAGSRGSSRSRISPPGGRSKTPPRRPHRP